MPALAPWAAKAATGEVGFHGVVQETDTASPFALRLMERHGRIVEAETIVARPQEAGVPFVTAVISTNPVLNEIVPPALRSSRARRAIHGETSCECCVRGRRSANVSPGKTQAIPV